MTDHKIGEETYRVGRLDTMAQLEIARRFSGALVFTMNAKMSVEDGVEITFEGLAKALLISSGQVPQRDFEYVIGVCLSVVSKIDGDHAFPVREPATGKLMFADMPMLVLIQVLLHVLEDHRLIDFFADPSPSSVVPAAPRQG